MLFMRLVKVGIDKEIPAETEKYYKELLDTVDDKPLFPVLIAMHGVMSCISNSSNYEDYSDVAPEYYQGIDDFIERATMMWREANINNWAQNTQLIHDVKAAHLKIRLKMADDELFSAIYADIASHLVEPITNQLLEEETTNGYLN